MRFLLLIIIVSSLVFVASSAAKTDHPVSHHGADAEVNIDTEPEAAPTPPATQDSHPIAPIVEAAQHTAPLIEQAHAEVETHVGEALAVVVKLNESQPKADDPERAGYCAPVPMLRVGDGSYGLFMDLYADDESRALYHSWGFTDAKIDPSTGAIYC